MSAQYFPDTILIFVVLVIQNQHQSLNILCIICPESEKEQEETEEEEEIEEEETVRQGETEGEEKTGEGEK